MVRYPLFDPAELDKERRVIIEELNMYRDSPQEWVGVIGEETFWPDLPLGREVAGTRESVESISLDALQAYRTSHYVPGKLVVSVVGNVEHESVRASVAALLGDWEPRPIPAFLPSPPRARRRAYAWSSAPPSRPTSASTRSACPPTTPTITPSCCSTPSLAAA